MSAAAQQNRASRSSSYRYACFEGDRLILSVRAYSPFVTLILPLVGILGYLYLDNLAAPNNRMGVLRWRNVSNEAMLVCAIAFVAWLGLLLRRSEKTVIDSIAGVIYKQHWFFRWKQAELSDVTGFVRFDKDDALYSSIYSLPLALFTRPSPLAHYATTSAKRAAGIRLTPDLPLDGRDLALFRERILPRLADMIAVHSVPGEKDGGGDRPTSSNSRDASRPPAIRDLLDDNYTFRALKL